MTTHVEHIYQQLLAGYQSDFQKVKKQLQLISLLRLVFFLSTILSVIYLWSFGAVVVVPIAVILFSGFLFLIKKYIAKEKEKEFFANLIKINQDELTALAGDFSHFRDGAEFTDLHHSFSYDLDLFGKLSFFQYLNRTATERGKQKLAEKLQKNETNAEIILQKQEAIEELATELNWRQHFSAKGKTGSDQQDFELLNHWSSTSFKLKNEKATLLLINILPILTVLAIIFHIFGVIPWGAVLLFVFTQWFLFMFYGKTIKKFYLLFGSHSNILSKYAGMLKEIENKKFNAKQLDEFKKRLYFNNQSASNICNKLGKLIAEFDYRQNIILAFILNSIFVWDIRCVYKLSQWHQKYHELPAKWFDVIAEFDAYSSFANFNFNHAEWIIPEPSVNYYLLDAEQLGHPLIDCKKRVNNDFKLNGEGKLAIITGANMAGKSTFLRTVGINLVLASNGCRVCAKRFIFTPVALYTNMRTTDNLMNDESYFYAELLRLQHMLERLRSGEKLFVIIDEMLKGTNSVDKLNGSKELIKQLIGLNTVGIVATHDLKLTDLAKQYPNSIQNQCFEVQLSNDDLSFDYTLRQGVTQTMNATFLMKKMGIIE